MAKVIIQAGAVLHKHTILNSQSIVEHDCIIGQFSHIAPGAILGGGVTIGQSSLIGLGAKVRDHLSVGDNCIVGTGAVLVSNAHNDEVLVGLPALPLKHYKKVRFEELCVHSDTSLQSAMEVIAKTGLTTALVVDKGILLGMLTDGDIRRAILKNASMLESVEAYMNKKYIAVHETVSHSSALDIMKAHGVNHLPVVDENGYLKDLHHISGVLEEDNPDVTVVIMAGGKGTRLLPLTQNSPKPLVRVAGKPILEHIILHLMSCRLREFYFAVNHLSFLIKEYFQDGHQYGCKINYLEEQRALGTGGALKLLPQKFDKPVLVLNGDLITQVDVMKMVENHKSQKNMISVGVRDYEVSVPYGVIKTENVKVIALDEKPTEHFLINAGIYLLEPELFEVIPENIEFPITDLIEHCLRNDLNVGVYLVEGDWMDVGQHKDLKEARGL